MVTGPMNAMLSSKLFRILGRLSYAVFLVHLVFQATVEANLRQPIYFSNFNLVWNILPEAGT